MAVIRVRKLFGRFDYEFDMGDMSKEGIIILSGPNGFGKTVMLEAINAISKSDLTFFLTLKFESFEVNRIEIEEKLKIEKTENGLRINNIELSNETIRLSSKGIFKREKILSRYAEFFEEQKRPSLPLKEELSETLKQMSQIFGEIQYIEQQRLINLEGEDRTVSRRGERRYNKRLLEVNSISERLENQIRNLNSKYSLLSNELDRTFLKRLFELEDGIDEEVFNEKIEKVKRKIRKLNDSGISKMGSLDVTRFKKEDARALKIYFEDFDKKYQVYEKMIEQIELYKAIVNKHFLFKHLEIADEQYLKVVDEDTGEKIRLNCLSSGEQEILVLYYKLLFEIPEKTIVLIDEPEISLHIAWQRMFIQDLKKIVALKNIFVVVATHSVQIVSGNRHIQYDLGELYKNGLN